MTNLTQSLQEKAVKEFDQKFSDLGEFKWPEGSDYLNRLAVRHLEARKFISSLVAEVVEETEKRVREEMAEELKSLMYPVGKYGKIKTTANNQAVFLCIAHITQPKEEK